MLGKLFIRFIAGPILGVMAAFIVGGLFIGGFELYDIPDNIVAAWFIVFAIGGIVALWDAPN